jgi:glycerol-3-phosphate acyltransferase PlsY
MQCAAYSPRMQKTVHICQIRKITLGLNISASWNQNRTYFRCLTEPCCPVLGSYPLFPVLAVLSHDCPLWLSFPGCSALALMFWPAYPLYPVVALSAGLSCPWCNALAVLSSLSCPGIIPTVISVLSRLSCPYTLVPSSPVPLSCVYGHVLAVLSSLSCLGWPVKADVSGWPVKADLYGPTCPD